MKGPSVPYDILINGGGIAGPSLAFWPTRQGHAVTITEQARQLRVGGQAVDFRGPSLQVLEKMGLLSRVRAHATEMGPMVSAGHQSAPKILRLTRPAASMLG